jgi:FtsP/CotA-like multicopper oxidase with cupredoxin domain
MYHSHQRGNVQVPMGLFGPLIVDEREPVAVDRDVTWVLSDWRLTSDGQISEDFGNMMDVAMAGRIGNVVTVNNRLPASWPVRAGERIRLRIINVASARMFSLSFEGHRPQVIAFDGQPVEPHEVETETLVLGPGMRVDLSLDMIGERRSAYAVWDSFYSGRSYRLATFAYAKEKASQGRAAKSLLRLPPIPPRESADVAFVADNPGDWMIHCHILDHQEAGMMGVVRVA